MDQRPGRDEHVRHRRRHGRPPASRQPGAAGQLGRQVRLGGLPAGRLGRRAGRRPISQRDRDRRRRAAATSGRRTPRDMRALQAPGRHHPQRRRPTTNPTASSSSSASRPPTAATSASLRAGLGQRGRPGDDQRQRRLGPTERVAQRSFSKGDWVTFPVNVAAGGTVTITATETAGTNAVLSGIMLGGAGAPPATGAAAVTGRLGRRRRLGRL